MQLRHSFFAKCSYIADIDFAEEEDFTVVAVNFNQFDPV